MHEGIFYELKYLKIPPVVAAGALCAHQRPAGLSTPLGAGGVRDTHRAVVEVVEGNAHKPVGGESKSKRLQTV